LQEWGEREWQVQGRMVHRLLQVYSARHAGQGGRPRSKPLK
jgi:hypothetical protein